MKIINAIYLNGFYLCLSIFVFYYSFDKQEIKELYNIWINWCACQESNPEPPDPKSGALSSWATSAYSINIIFYGKTLIL